MIDTNLASDNLLRFRKNPLERILKLTKTIVDKIRNRKLQYNINKETAKISALPLGEVDEYGEKNTPDQSRMIEKAKFTDFSFRKSV